MHSIVISTSDWLNLTFINIDILPGALLPQALYNVGRFIFYSITDSSENSSSVEGRGEFVSFNKNNNPSKSSKISRFFCLFLYLLLIFRPSSHRKRLKPGSNLEKGIKRREETVIKNID